MNIAIPKYLSQPRVRQLALHQLPVIQLGNKLLIAAVLLLGMALPASAQEALNDLANQQPAPIMVPEAAPAPEPALPPVVGVPSPVVASPVVPTAAPAEAAPLMQPAEVTAPPAMPTAEPIVTTPAKPTTPVVALPNAPTNTPAVVTEVVGKLQQTEKNISLEDMAKAQDALARLDLLLEIEQKLGEIKNVQDQRADKATARRPLGSGGGTGGGAGGAAGIGTIPASALALPLPAQAMQPMMTAPRPMPAPVIDARAYKVEQIGGTSGNFTATLIMPNGTKRPVRRGDEFSGVKVTDITARGVTLRTDKGLQTIAVDADGLELAPRSMVR